MKLFFSAIMIFIAYAISAQQFGDTLEQVRAIYPGMVQSSEKDSVFAEDSVVYTTNTDKDYSVMFVFWLGKLSEIDILYNPDVPVFVVISALEDKFGAYEKQGPRLKDIGNGESLKQTTYLFYSKDRSVIMALNDNEYESYEVAFLQKISATAFLEYYKDQKKQVGGF